ncbi:unannotated protein [freshwater metagenome]|jgi:hypothetical protein|uniref:Unannotated protein n=1 Tax=freshwater metagenome TaxID=449393 RepID=A0A6J7ML38_9ZZZZ|nr:hypothetical protein [Actinomycetota bacterium]MSZ57661.1 hypothetical protein [Actinomycetota bacterium]
MMVRLADEDLSSVIDGAGPLAGLFVILLAVAVFIIWKSMNRQFKRIDPSLPMGRDDREQAADRRYTEQAVERGEEPAPSTEQGKDDIAPAG